MTNYFTNLPKNKPSKIKTMPPRTTFNSRFKIKNIEDNNPRKAVTEKFFMFKGALNFLFNFGFWYLNLNKDKFTKKKVK